VNNDFAARVMQRIPDMVAYLDTELRYQYTNEAYQKTLGKPAEKILGKSVAEILSAEVVAHATPKWQAALQGKAESYDTQITLEDGRKIWVHVRLMPDFDPDGSIPGFFVIVTDVTARREAEARLQRLRALNDDLPSLLAHCDAQERYLYVNRAYASAYQHTPESVVGMRVRDVVTGELYERIQPYIAQLLQGEPIEFEMLIPYADGSEPWMIVRGIPERVGKDVVGFFVSISDISKHKELEMLRRQFTSATVHAQEAERKALAQELHDGVAQELAALAVISNMLERKAASEKDVSILQMLQDGLQRTVNETRRLSYGLHPLVLRERGLISAVEELLKRTRQVHDEVTIDFNRQGWPDSAPARADADIAIYRIVQESISNALRHGNPQHIELSLGYKNGALCGKILDDGKGFDASSPHAGLGLASMKDRVLLLGGTIHIRSDDTGTCIEFCLPANPQTAMETPRSAPAAARERQSAD